MNHKKQLYLHVSRILRTDINNIQHVKKQEDDMKNRNSGIKFITVLKTLRIPIHRPP